MYKPGFYIFSRIRHPPVNPHDAGGNNSIGHCGVHEAVVLEGLIMRVFVLLLLWITPVLVNAAGAEQGPWDKTLPFEKATVTYELSGNEQGAEVMYIADNGRRTATYRTSVTSMMGMKMTNETVSFQDPDWIYIYDLKEQTGTKATNPVKYMREEYEKLSPEEKKNVQKNAERFGVSMMGVGGGDFQENAGKLLGYDCDRTTMMGTTVYTIHSTPVPLKTETSIMGMKMNSVATSFEKGKAAAGKFEHPVGITAVHDPQGDSFTRQMAQQTVAWLKDPDASAENAPKMGMPPGMGGGHEQQVPPENQEMMKQAEQMMEGLKGMFGN